MWNPISWDTMFAVGDAEALTALQQLRHLRVDCCVTVALSRNISRLTQLTSLELRYDDINYVDYYDPDGLEVGREACINLGAHA
jgi:hypothetical protein